jgi:hypothetical protein
MQSPCASKFSPSDHCEKGKKRPYDHPISACGSERVTQGTAGAMEENYALHVTPMNVLRQGRIPIV